MVPLGTTTFNKVVGVVNIVLALVLAVSLVWLAFSVAHDRKDATTASVPYCKCPSAAWHDMGLTSIVSPCTLCVAARHKEVPAEPDISER